MVIDAAGIVYITGVTSTVSFSVASDLATIKYNPGVSQLWAVY